MEGMGTRYIKILKAERFLDEQRITSENFPLGHLPTLIENSGPLVGKRPIEFSIVILGLKTRKCLKYMVSFPTE